MFFNDCENLNDLKKKYHKLLLKYHPDCGGDEETAKKITAEYSSRFDVLKNKQNAQADAGVKGVHKTTETPEKFINICEKLFKIPNIDVELCGSWIWIAGETKEHKDELKAAGCRWSKNKQKWYWRHEENSSHWRSRNYTMEEIRERHGSMYLKRNTAPLAKM